jgi:hypothetical protein
MGYWRGRWLSHERAGETIATRDPYATSPVRRLTDALSVATSTSKIKTPIRSSPAS